MIHETILENLLIHNCNLSVYYLGSIFITVISVIIAWWYHRYCINMSDTHDPNVTAKKEELEGNLRDTVPKECDQSEDATTTKVNSNVKSEIKISKHSLVEEVAANLTDEQLIEEKQIEKQQLEAIFQLLQNQQDKYQVSSMEELEDQLRLYR